MEAPFKTPGGGKKKLSNKKVMFLAIGGVLVVVLVLMRRPAASNPDAPTAYVAEGYENFGSAGGGVGVEQVDARVDTALNAAMASLEADNNALMNGYFQTANDYIKERDDQYAKQLKKLTQANKKLNTELDQQEKLDKDQAAALKKLQDQLKKPEKKPIKSQPVTPIKNPPRTTPKKPAKSQNVKINYAGNSIVDALKKAGIGSTMTNRAEIAAGNGIKGYRGTAAQNTALLKKAKAGTLKITPSMRK